MKQNLRFLMLTLLCAVFSMAWGETETVFYTLTPATGSNNAYANNCDIAIDGITWNVTGNAQYTPWRIGGKSLDKVDRTVYSKTAMGSEINKVELTVGSATDITVNSLKLVVASDAAFSTILNEVSATFVANSKITFEPTSGEKWDNKSFYKFIFNVSVSGTSNKFVQFSEAKFYAPSGSLPQSDKYYVAGSWTNWETGKIEMTKKSNGTYTLGGQELQAEAKFKIIKEAPDGTITWYGGEGHDPNNNNPYWLTADNHTDISLFTNGDAPNFYMPIAGTWTFTVDPTGDTPKLTVDGDWPEWEYYLVGDFNEWATTSIDSYKFTDAGLGKFTLNKPIKKGEKFKIYAIRGSEEKWFGAVSNGDFWVNAEHVNEALSLTTENGGENFYMNLSNKKSYWELEFDPVNMTLTLGNFVSDVAELPFVFDDGRSAIQNTPGLTSTTGLGDDYNNSPKLQFKATSQELVLHFDERPGTLSFDIKGNSFSGGSFEVLTSENGEDYTVLKTYTSLSSATTGQHEVFENLGENVRYIKWLYKQKSSGNVALGNIKLEKYVAPESYTLTITPNDNAEIFVFYNEPDNNWPEIASGDEVMATSEVLVSISVEEGYELESVTVTDGDGQPVELTEEEEGISWTFIMPNSNVTVACSVKEEVEREIWVKTDLADLTENDIFVIVGNVGNNENYALPNDKGTTTPDAVSVSVVQNKIITSVPDRIKWNVSGDATNGYIFRPNGDEENWLYLKDKSTNKGVYVGTSLETDGKHLFTIVDGYLYNEATERYIGIYNKGDWRCYTSTTTNISDQEFAFYKLVKFDFSINKKASDGTVCYATISALGEGNWKVSGDVEVSTVIVNSEGKLEYPVKAQAGDVIPGDGAYLVKGAAGDYSFNATNKDATITIGDGDNMLLSTGEGNFTTVAPNGESNDNYYFYKVSLNKKGVKNSVGFYWGSDDGSAFTYNKGHQAYLAVPKDDALNVQGFSFDGTTGIAEVETAVNGNDEVYTISGMRVDGSNLSKGVYIVNGKKVIIK